MSDSVSPLPSFRDLALIDPVLKALDDIGYETPSPIQAKIIPFVLAGKDVLGQAQTGTGKTAAFALPLLSRIDLKIKDPQVLVLAPTRELAIQVAEAFQGYAARLKGFHVLPIYGGQDYNIQLKQLARGVHVVVGTPGRVMDHMRRGTLKLDSLQCLVLDEADEMLRMGFIDDVEWILEQTPAQRQIALFSATMPSVIRKIAQKHLNNPEEVTIKVKTTETPTIRQRFWFVSGLHKLDALTRILEAETFDGMIIFVKTKTATIELAEKLEARGYSAAAINGDLSQALRERTIEHLKNGKIDILIATDVAARGLDVDRISHVINYDIPYDTESYIHRIGRTGRAGRSGDAILFVSPREKRLLSNIEIATKRKVEEMQLPSTELINNNRISRFKQRITDTLAAEGLSFYSQLIEQYEQEHNIPAIEIAAALAKLLQGDIPLLLKHPPKVTHTERSERSDRESRSDKPRRERSERSNDSVPRERSRSRNASSIEMELFRIEVGHSHGVKPGNIVGAIANESGIDGDHIARIKIEEDYSTVELPAGMPKDLLQTLRKVRVAGQALNISKVSDAAKAKDKSKKRISSVSKKAKPAAAE
jgi:ATP-dependent RNA helicase DeaD